MNSKISFFKKIWDSIILGEKLETIIIILSGPSAIGKSTVAALLLKNYPNMQRVITATSRKPRTYETKVDYIFLTEKKFKNQILRNAFLEYSQVYGFYYGILKKEFRKVQKKFLYTLLILDTAGSQKIMDYAKKKNIQCKSIFLMTKSIQIIEERMKLRGDDKKQRVDRLKKIEKELEMVKKFDKKIYNDNLETCFQQLQNFIDL